MATPPSTTHKPGAGGCPRLPPGPGLSAQGWGAKPREEEMRGREGERRSKRKERGGAVSKPLLALGAVWTEALFRII